MLSQASFQFLSELLLLSLVVSPVPSQALNLPCPFKVTESGHLNGRHGNRIIEHKVPWRDVADQKPVKLRKMSNDEGEMFLQEYWSFEAISMKDSVDQKHTGSRSLDRLVDRDESKEWTNASMSAPLQAPFALHVDQNLNPHPVLGRFLKSPRDTSPLQPRAFSCPGDTTACTSINRPNSCCPNGSTCQSIPDSGSGDVGCCGVGETCGSNVAGCPSEDLSCPGSAGGGCCVPGYTCAGVGCVISSTAVTTIQPVVTASPSSSLPKSASWTTRAPPPPVVPASAPSPSTANTDATTATSTFTAVTSVISTATASSSHISTASPSSSSTPRPSPSTSASPILPIRPTSSASIPTRTTTAAPTTITASTCPTGFYPCSAYNHLGCCRVGRDCGLTSCPAASSTLAINSNGVTVNVIPSGSGDAGCAAGWFSCATGQGGGCCPSGYACGTSCTATGVVVQGGQTGTATVAKNNEGGKVGVGLWMPLMGGVGMILMLV